MKVRAPAQRFTFRIARGAGRQADGRSELVKIQKVVKKSWNAFFKISTWLDESDSFRGGSGGFEGVQREREGQGCTADVHTKGVSGFRIQIPRPYPRIYFQVHSLVRQKLTTTSLGYFQNHHAKKSACQIGSSEPSQLSWCWRELSSINFKIISTNLFSWNSVQWFWKFLKTMCWSWLPIFTFWLSEFFTLSMCFVSLSLESIHIRFSGRSQKYFWKTDPGCVIQTI